MAITHLSIRNFRSILSLSEGTRDLNIFVGQNDEGKSNILRALDLFFNHDQPNGYQLEWTRDYCSFATPRAKRAPEITIQLEVTPPPSFSTRTPVIWTKTWRRDGLYHEDMTYAESSEIGARSKIRTFLKSMRYDYVPAIKGKEYFQGLMGSLHDMLEATVEEQIRAASGSFTATINHTTQPILDSIRENLSLDTTIQLPSNLRDLFAQLEFTSISSNKAFSLDQRGDGIKVRHIPIVLRWLAQQANHLSAQGRPRTVTVWGYEEPENNLELMRCLQLAKEFVEGSSEIQAFVTTHSPAFYSVFRDSDQEKVSVFLVEKDDSSQTSLVRALSTSDDLASLDTSMGLLSLLEPHFKQVRQELASVQSAMSRLTDTSVPTIFVEGPTDKTVFEETIRLWFPEFVGEVRVLCATHHGGGHNWVADMLIAWSFNRPLAKAVGVFDKDEGAQKSRRTISGKVKCNTMVKVAELIPGPDLIECYNKNIRIPFAIEELYSREVWDHAEKNSWLDVRSNPIALYNFDRTDVTFDDYIRSVFEDAHLLRLALSRVRPDRKQALTKYVCGTLDESSRRRALESFRPTIAASLKQLGLG